MKDKVVLISGAGKGIGKAIALTFACNGAKVIFFDKDPNRVKEVKADLEKINIPHLAKVLDISNLSALPDFIKEVKDKFGRVDILVNNAGVGLAKKFLQTSPEDLDQVWSVNFKGSYLLTKEVKPLMMPGASIIFITSIHATNPSLDPSYDSSKAAINNLTINLSLELAKDGIRVNAIAPGHIDVDHDQPRKQEDVPLYKEAGTPDDIAQACLFLADSLKARYITGVILPVTGGLHIPIARDLKILLNEI